MKLFKLFKKKEVISIEDVISNALNIKGINVIDLEQHNRRIMKDIARRWLFNLPNRKRTQSVSERIHARPRKRGNVTMKHIRNECARKDLFFMKEYCPQNRLLMDVNAQRTISYNIIDCTDND